MGDQSENRALERSEYRPLRRPLRLPLKRQLRRWIPVLGSLSAMLMMRAMPAIAAELRQWDYDSQTRSLTLVLSATVTPTVSVLSDNQLLIELPDTQVGDVIAQQVNDGMVDSIVVRQTSPDTVWMVVAFLPGTVLADSQALAPIGAADAPGPNLQQWQVRPALLSGSSANTQAGTQARTQADSRPTEMQAAARELAQFPDFPDLPVLEPASPLDAPISVPLPVNLLPASLPSVNPQPISPLPSNLPAAAADDDGLPSLVSIPAVRVPAVSVPPLPTQPVEPVASEPLATPEPPQSVAEIAPLPAEEPAVPIEPPFIGALGDLMVPLPLPEDLIEPENLIEADESPASVAPSVAAESTVPAATGTVALTVEPPVEPSRPVDAIANIDLDPSPTPITPANVNRWPDPIPFGQPLP